jgi:predicted permease
MAAAIPYRVVATLPLFGAFVLGLGSRRWLQRHFALLFRVQVAVGMGLVAVLAGWSFELSVANVAAVGVLLGAQLAAVALAARLFRRSSDGPLLAFGMFGNPTFWSLPVAAVALGAEAAVFVVAYDMLTQPRIAVGLKLLRSRAPIPQSPRSALADYAPTAGAVAGVVLGRLVTAPEEIATVVTALGIAMAMLGSMLLGVAWPREWIGRCATRLSLRGLALHLTFVPAVLGVGTLLGLDVPGAAWILALGPLPLSIVSFARLYGYSTRTAATGLALSVAAALALVPVAVALGG